MLLTQKFSCINEKLQNNHRVRSSQFWNEIWCAYKVSVDLVERTNELNGGTILISFFSNLYFICVQLLGCFKSEMSLLDGLYLWFSLIFLIGRTLGIAKLALKLINAYRTRFISQLFVGTLRKLTTNRGSRCKYCGPFTRIILMLRWNASPSSLWPEKSHWVEWTFFIWPENWFWAWVLKHFLASVKSFFSFNRFPERSWLMVSFWYILEKP